MVLLLSVVLLLIPPAFAIVENDTLAVTSNSPVVYGSTVVFHAEVLQGTGALQDEKKFRFKWKSDVFESDVETTFANFNSSVSKCYAFVEPGSYNMTVTVWDQKELSDHKVGIKKVGFELTAKLNGNLQAAQNLSHKSPQAQNNTFSTGKPVHLNVNLTDLLSGQASISYDWFIGKVHLVTTNEPHFTHNITTPGKHIINVTARVDKKQLLDCRGGEYREELNGTFQTELDMKVPVGNYLVFGKEKLHVGEGANLTIIWQSGSPPFTLSWQLLSGNGTTLINASKHVILATSANISVPAKPLASPGSYSLLIQVENMVSLLKRNQTLQVKDRNTPDSSHSPFLIVLSVTGGLVFMTIAVIVFVKVRQHQENHQHIETADFDFHPELHSQSYSATDEPPATFAAWVKSVVKKLGGTCASVGNKRGGVNGSVNSYEGTKNKRLTNYGSLTDSVNDSIDA